DVIDLRNENRIPLAIRKAGRFTFFAEGLEFGNAALSTTATKPADLVIVDEFGPLELSGQGWRKNVDSLITSSNALILLVVRHELADEVQLTYSDYSRRNFSANESESINEVIEMLRDCRQLQRETT
ncbi:MAG: nucleoside-triphosphatase, partial [Planctomycetota bacterium]